MTNGGEDAAFGPSGGRDAEPHDEKPIGELFGRLIDEGKAYAKAEVGLAKASAEATANQFKGPAILLFASLLFAQAAVTVAAATVALALAPVIGPLPGGLVAVSLTAGAAWLLYSLAMARLKALK